MGGEYQGLTAYDSISFTVRTIAKQDMAPTFLLLCEIAYRKARLRLRRETPCRSFLREVERGHQTLV